MQAADGCPSPLQAAIVGQADDKRQRTRLDPSDDGDELGVKCMLKKGIIDARLAP